MKYILAVITAVFMVTNIAHAETTERNVVQSVVTHHYVTETIQHRISNRVCNEVDVPIYGNTGKAQTGEVLGGAIIGGILGNQVGGGKGKDAATLLGAILGADFANKKGGTKTIVGYKRTTVCEDTPTYEIEERQVYSHSTIRFTDTNSATYTLKFKQRL
jgi:uncharacterized protein YcfJ